MSYRFRVKLGANNLNPTHSLTHLVVRFYFYAHPCWALGKKPQAFIQKKTLNLFLFNCEHKTVDHGDFENSNFEDERQPEIAV